MGMGYGAGYADTVEESFVKKHAPSEFKSFTAAIAKAHISLKFISRQVIGIQFVVGAYLDDAAKAIEYNDTIEYNDQDWEGEPNENEIKELIKEINKAWTSLRRTFSRKTGLSLDMGFHDKDNEGDRYDDINGYYFCVGNVWTKTKPGQKYARNISRKMFVTYG